MLPKLSAPLVKDIRTGEGILEWGLAAADIVAGATGNLSWSHTAQYATAVAISKAVRRGLLKIVALQKGYGIGDPIAPPIPAPGKLLGVAIKGTAEVPFSETPDEEALTGAPESAATPDPEAAPDAKATK